MLQAIIRTSPGYLLTSHGNGLAYALKRRSDGREVFFQGDDADKFREELEAWEGSADGTLSTEHVLSAIFCNYDTTY